LVGSSLIPANQPIGMAVWAIICLIGVIALKSYGTADRKKGKPTDWTHTIICSVAFVIWVYVLGGPFVAFNLHVPWIGSLAVLTYTFFVPIFYRGSKD
jgi:hypothetical protein